MAERLQTKFAIDRSRRSVRQNLRAKSGTRLVESPLAWTLGSKLHETVVRLAVISRDSSATSRYSQASGAGRVESDDFLIVADAARHGGATAPTRPLRDVDRPVYLAANYGPETNSAIIESNSTGPPTKRNTHPTIL